MLHKDKFPRVFSLVLLSLLLTFTNQSHSQDDPEETAFPEISFTWSLVMGSCNEIAVMPSTQNWCSFGTKTYTWEVNGVLVTPSMFGVIDLSSFSSPYEVCLRATCSGFFDFPIGPHCKTIEIPDVCCDLTSNILTLEELTDFGDCKKLFRMSGLPHLEEDMAAGLYCVEWLLNGFALTELSEYIGPYDQDILFKGYHGTQVVCVRVYCCEEPSIYIEDCITVEVDCELECEQIEWDELTYGVQQSNCETVLYYVYKGVPIELGDLICRDGTSHIGTFSSHGHEPWGHWYRTDVFSCGGTIVQEDYLKCCDGEDEHTIFFDVPIYCDADSSPSYDLILDAWALGDPNPSALDPCTKNFEIVTSGVDETSLCYNWYLDGSIGISTTDPYLQWDFECDESGEHTLCAEVFCCVTGEILYSECIDFYVNCPCCGPAPNYTLDVTQPVDCGFSFKLNWTTVLVGYDPSDICFLWYKDGVLMPWGGDEISIILSPGSGSVEICVKVVCCETGSIYMEDCVSINCQLPPPNGLAPSDENEQSSTGNGLFIYPNPVSTGLTWNIGEHVDEVFQINLINSLGQVLISETRSASSGQIDVQGLAKGWYILEFLFDGERLSDPVLIE